jgi:hypothetical protein
VSAEGEYGTNMGRMRQIGPMGVWDGVGVKRVYVPYAHPSHLSHPSHICPIHASGAQSIAKQLRQ